MSEESDEVLMRAYVEGDARAFEVLFERHAPAILDMARRQLRSEDQARDVLQQTFLHVHRARRDFRADARLKPWLFTIAANLLREQHRRRGRRSETSYERAREAAPGVEPRVEAPDIAELEATRLDVHRLREALHKLPDSQRVVIELHWIEGRPFAEVASLVGASVSAVKVRAHRGYVRLRGLVSRARDEASAPRPALRSTPPPTAELVVPPRPLVARIWSEGLSSRPASSSANEPLALAPGFHDLLPEDPARGRSGGGSP